MLKVPASAEAGAHEHAALVQWESGPVPAVEAYDPGTGSLLLQELQQHGAGYGCDDLVRLARRLHVPAPPGTDPAAATCRMLLDAARDHHRGRVTERRHEADLRTAEALMRRLSGAGEPVLLHGDLLHKNLVPTRDGLYAIDPQPVAGPVELDLARWVAWGGQDHVTGFEELADGLVEAAERPGGERLDRERLVAWTWAVSVCENKPGRAGEHPRVAFLDAYRPVLDGSAGRR